MGVTWIFIFSKMRRPISKFACGILLLFFAVNVFAQHGVPEPKWVRHIPQSTSSSFYYRVTYSKGRTYDQAYTRAFAKAIYENACKRGITVDVNMSMEEIEKDVEKQINVDQRSMKLFLNKACEYWEQDASGLVCLYVLWQIGQNGKKDPEFEPYNACDAL